MMSTNVDDLEADSSWLVRFAVVSKRTFKKKILSNRCVKNFQKWFWWLWSPEWPMGYHWPLQFKKMSRFVYLICQKNLVKSLCWIKLLWNNNINSSLNHLTAWKEYCWLPKSSQETFQDPHCNQPDQMLNRIWAISVSVSYIFMNTYSILTYLTVQWFCEIMYHLPASFSVWFSLQLDNCKVQEIKMKFRSW